MQNSFWDKTHPLFNEYSRLYSRYIPQSGETQYVETECLRAANRIVYDYYNNGFCNNKSQELEFIFRFSKSEPMLMDAIEAVRPYVTCAAHIPSFKDQDFCNKINYLIAYSIQVILDNENSLTPLVIGIHDMPRMPDEEPGEDDYYDEDEDED